MDLPRRLPSPFALGTGAAILLIFGLIWLAPESAEARRIPKITGAEAEVLLADRSTPLVLAFGVQGCHMCRAATKILRTVAKEGPPGVRYAEVDLDEAESLGQFYAVRGAPYQLVFDAGRLVHRTGSLESATELRDVLAQARASR